MSFYAVDRKGYPVFYQLIKYQIHFIVPHLKLVCNLLYAQIILFFVQDINLNIICLYHWQEFS